MTSGTSISLSAPVSKPISSNILDYSEILTKYGLHFTPSEYYWQVGQINKPQGWILHLSVIRIQLVHLIYSILPELLNRHISFKIVRDYDTAGYLLDGNLGSSNLGKVISLYPNTDEETVELAQVLINITKMFKGPVILTDVHLGSIVYSRYGSFKPLYAKDVTGQLVKLIHNTKGELIPDQYHIPFILPKDISWPFSDIISPLVAKRPRLLNNSYYPIEVIKPDAKGKVMKAIYFKRFWQIKPCLIKQGRLNMATDNDGRDIQDRLKWQYEIYKELAGIVPLPEIFDMFTENGDCYLAMEFIKGDSFNKWMSILYINRSWISLSANTQTLLLKKFLQILDIISTLHNKGYIHRDITPENFLIDKKGKLFLIDMELSYNSASKNPFPPFRLGTPGFMSPEQFAVKMPTISEDLYALGAFMLQMFTNLLPEKFKGQSSWQIAKNVSFLSGEEKIADLVVKCLNIDPTRRPSLPAITSAIKELRETVIQKKGTKTHSRNDYAIPAEKINQIVQAGIEGLSKEAFLANEYWFSKRPTNEMTIGNIQVELGIFEGWHTGVSGTLWLLARAKRAGFSITTCERIFFKNWNWVRNQFVSENCPEIAGSLFMGKAGVAFTICEFFDSHLLEPNLEILNLLTNCFSNQATGLRLSDGISGQGMALLRSMHWLDSTQLGKLLDSYIEIIAKEQQSDGSWNFPTVDDGPGVLDDFANREEGLLLFLISYLKYGSENNRAKKMVKKSLSRMLVDKSSQHKPGNMLLFVKAFEVLRDPIYKKRAEEIFEAIHPRPVWSDFTLGKGLAGLGEIYMNGFNTLNDKKWIERADWIAFILFNHFITITNDAGYWMPNETDTVTADLFRGNSGILHFLLRYRTNLKLGHPLLPN